jgi:hypothetical protein
MSSSSPARDVVRQQVAEGLGRRRARHAVAALARVAPWVTGGTLLIAIAGRLLAWPTSVSWIALAAAVLGLGAWFVWLRRLPQATDAVAASLDRDAALGGELRSAFWFADQSEHTSWATFHVERAAQRLAIVRWSDFYPPVRATRSWMIAIGLALAAAIVTVRLPARLVRVAAGKNAAAQVDPSQVPLEALLPPDVRKRLEELMSQIEAGKIQAAAAAAKLEDLKELLSKIDPSLEPALADLAKRSAEAAAAESGKADAKSLAERAKEAARSDMPADLRQQLEDMANRLANPRVGERQGNSNEAANSSDAGQLGKSSAGAEASQANAAQAAMQLSREAASSSNGQMMLAGAGSMSGGSQGGSGGNQGARMGAAGAASIAQALRQELIEASADTQGQNVSAEDIRRKTEQGKSSLGFTHVVAPPAVDPSRTLPPPAVPDARKALVMQYFIRRQ